MRPLWKHKVRLGELQDSHLQWLSRLLHEEVPERLQKGDHGNDAQT